MSKISIKTQLNLKTILDSPVVALPYIGRSLGITLEKYGLLNAQDLIERLPFRYTDSSELKKISQLNETEKLAFMGKVIDIFGIKRGKYFIVEAELQDSDNNRIKAIWFNQKYILMQLKRNSVYKFMGKVSKGKLASPKFESIDKSVHIGRITPEYNSLGRISSARFRYLYSKLREYIEDIPRTPLDKLLSDLPSYKDSLLSMHYPQTEADIESARERLAIEELIPYAYKSIQKAKKTDKKIIKIPQSSKQETNIINIAEKIYKPLESRLNFKLTPSQVDTIIEIIKDIDSNALVNSVINGDVGSGKTVIALSISDYITDYNYKSVIMCPTTILAEQHYKYFQKYLPQKKILQITGKEKKNKEIDSADIIVGTHALLYRELPQNIGLIVVDEEHRFGVEQREKLQNLKNSDGTTPHYFSMTATPIPRTLVKILYNDTKVYYLQQNKDRNVKTKVVLPEKHTVALDWMKDILNRTNEKVLFVLPLIEISDNISAISIETLAPMLKHHFGDKHELAIVHGGMKNREKIEILDSFRRGDIRILVGTTVVEVGIDIQDLHHIFIYNPERFGYAQLHQLRGRVGRDGKQAYCILMTEKESERLSKFTTISDGFELAEMDLDYRGPGDIFGTEQSGVPNFKLATLKEFKKFDYIRDITAQGIRDGVINQDTLHHSFNSYFRNEVSRSYTINT